MSEILRPYETLFIINPEIGEEAISATIEKFKSLIDSEGKIEKVDQWGKRKLAYEINDLREGFYVLINFSVNTDFIKELERQFKINDAIIRYTVVKREEG